MKTVSTWFSEAIDRYAQLIAQTKELKENMLTLPLEKTVDRCQSLRKLQQSFVDCDENLYRIMDFIGADILDNPLVGEYQRVFDLAKKEIDRLAAEINLRKDILLQNLALIDPLNESDPRNHPDIRGYNSMLQ